MIKSYRFNDFIMFYFLSKLQKISVILSKKEKSIEIAKKMKNANKAIEEIIEFTGLTKEEIEKL